MLPFGVAQEPRPLFYGNAGFRLHFPAHFELSEAQEASGSLPEREMQNGRDLLPRQPLAAHSMEACIGHRLQVIGDQFHRDHLQRYYQNHLHQRPVWWRLATALLSLLFGRGGRGAVGQSHIYSLLVSVLVREEGSSGGSWAISRGRGRAVVGRGGSGACGGVVEVH
uniref:Uncharacterized protein n=1 Tax=Knipowitschia caucasica TaxID=637954 RepID=A0AAV2JG55_KNICA